MEQVTVQTIIEGGILITLIYIGGVLVKILRSTTKIEGDTGVIAAAATDGSAPKGGPSK
ncbi:hypothetical protein [Limnovirga soli]|jgi:hypothetical protein|uniref:hypothetical protein n=1 Tax=Limnovirga soli TaxID=2656915 RepID=UPI0014926F34|nr:hypothetical protein [Limnovirga soli]